MWKTVITLYWGDNTPEGDYTYCDILNFMDTYEERKQAIEDILPVTKLRDMYGADLQVEAGNDHYLALKIFHGEKAVARAEFTQVLHQGNSYFELNPIRIYPTFTKEALERR